MEEFQIEESPSSTINKQLINIPLGINLNDEFETYEEFDNLLKETSQRHFLHFWKRDCRTVEGAKKKTDRYINPKIKYYQLKYSCIQGGRVFRRKNKSLEECEANFYLTATPNGDKLFVKSLNNIHNHEVSEAVYLKYFNGEKYKRGPKKKDNTELEYTVTYSTQSETEDTNTNSDNKEVKDTFPIENNCLFTPQYDHYSSAGQFSRDTDGIDEFLKYISSEMRQIRSPKVLKCLKRKFINLVQQAQDEDESI